MTAKTDEKPKTTPADVEAAVDAVYSALESAPATALQQVGSGHGAARRLATMLVSGCGQCRGVPQPCPYVSGSPKCVEALLAAAYAAAGEEPPGPVVPSREAWLAAALADNCTGEQGQRMSVAEWLEWARMNAEAEADATGEEPPGPSAEELLAAERYSVIRGRCSVYLNVCSSDEWGNKVDAIADEFIAEAGVRATNEE